MREKERAADWLLTRPDRAYPELLAKARAGRAGPAVVELLGRFGNDDSVPVLVALLERADPRGFAAARALAVHPSPTALAALRDGVRSGGDTAVLSADAIGERGDATACEDLRVAAGDHDARVRYHAIQAAASIGCLSPDELSEIAVSDLDGEVRELAGRLR